MYQYFSVFNHVTLSVVTLNFKKHSPYYYWCCVSVFPFKVFSLILVFTVYRIHFYSDQLQNFWICYDISDTILAETRTSGQKIYPDFLALPALYIWNKDIFAVIGWVLICDGQQNIARFDRLMNNIFSTRLAIAYPGKGYVRPWVSPKPPRAHDRGTSWTGCQPITVRTYTMGNLA